MSDVRNEILKLRSDVSTGRKIIAGLVLVLIVLVALLFKSSGSFSQTIIPPNLSQPFTVTNNEISPSYLEDMAVWVAYLSEDYTPKSIEYKQEKLKKLFNPEIFGVMDVELQKKKDYVIRN
ncbi:MAG: type IV conjugative transfer system protein TraE, partial [Proteobacteria bacterium]|nr:type IV conjugative transfer system protein TraE [Pseudomonadota bacterium]